jgi:two-component system, LytTR family, sensor kinase
MIHPITANRTRFLAWWLIWLTLGLGQSALLYFLCDCGLKVAATDGMLSALLYSLISIAIWYPLIQFRPQSRSYILIATNYLTIGSISIAIWLLGVKWITASLYTDQTLYLDFWKTSFYYRAGIGIFLFAVVVLSYHLIMSMENISKKTLREANLENMLRETELLMLRSQINPHFLFNSLNSISSLTITDPAAAREMVIKLSDFMRYALSRKNDKMVPLKTELENLRLYLEIEKVRFGNKLSIIEDIDPESNEIKIPNMILQPLYENAVKHGVYESIEKVDLIIKSRSLPGGISVTIENSFDPSETSRPGTGTGLQNVKRRLELVYKGEARLDTRKEDNKFRAEIYFPANTQAPQY